MIRHRRSLVAALLLLVSAACGRSEGPEPTPAERGAPVAAPDDVDPRTLAAFARLPARFESPDNPITAEKVALGRQLYFDPRLSSSGTLSCNTCHDLSKHGVDPRPGPVSLGYRDQPGARNSPTVLNAAGLVAQFWDGRAPTVEEQALGPILNPVEMAMPDGDRVVAVVSSIPGYVDAFRRAFPGERDAVTFDNIGRAIGAYERTLVTPSRFDFFLAGDRSALTASERRGLRAFIDAGCPTCHSGALVGGTSFQKLGLTAPYANTEDAGRYAVTRQEADRMVFRVASLRNVAETGPWFHDGRVTGLDAAVAMMGKLQLGRDLTGVQVNDILAFLRTLSANPDPSAVTAPELPPSGPRTPRPVP